MYVPANNRPCETVNQNCLGQFGTINVSAALSKIIFCKFSLQLLGLIDKQKIEGVEHLNANKSNDG